MNKGATVTTKGSKQASPSIGIVTTPMRSNGTVTVQWDTGHHFTEFVTSLVECKVRVVEVYEK
ncbi:MAG: hypothetical protein ACW99J_19225 [Candidatus Thorarchaeota archaeon]|jgi:hypothetical protein